MTLFRLTSSFLYFLSVLLSLAISLFISDVLDNPNSSFAGLSQVLTLLFGMIFFAPLLIAMLFIDFKPNSFPAYRKFIAKTIWVLTMLFLLYILSFLLPV